MSKLENISIIEGEDYIYDICSVMFYLRILSGDKVIKLEDRLYYYWLWKATGRRWKL